jgi:hypothetical protein
MGVSIQAAQAAVDRTAHTLALAIDKMRADDPDMSYNTALELVRKNQPKVAHEYGAALMFLAEARAGGPVGPEQHQDVRS